MILKLDFEKAFDKVEHEVILQVLNHKGFSPPPLLFVMAADLLQSVINDDADRGVLAHPLGPSFGGCYPIVQYADDTLLIMPADSAQLSAPKDILAIFTSSTGLKLNYNKSFLVPINIEASKMTKLAQVLGWPTPWPRQTDCD